MDAKQRNELWEFIDEIDAQIACEEEELTNAENSVLDAECLLRRLRNDREELVEKFPECRPVRSEK